MNNLKLNQSGTLKNGFPFVIAEGPTLHHKLLVSQMCLSLLIASGLLAR